MASSSLEIPQWKKDLIARLKQSSKKNEERYWFDPHPPIKQPIVSDLILPPTENGYNGKTDRKSSKDSNSSEEDLHYGPGIVNKLKNKYLSLALREASTRPTILRKATSLENLLDEDESAEDRINGGGRLYRSRGGDTAPGSHLNRYNRHGNRQEMKRARSVEAISRRLNSDSSLSPTSLVPPNVNNRQSFHEDMLLLGTAIDLQENDKRSVKKMATATENGVGNVDTQYSSRVNRPKRIQPLLSEKEKPPLDVVSKAKMIFEKRPETRTKKPPQTGDVAAKVEGFNSIIVKSKVASKKPPIKHTKPVLSDKQKNTHNPHHHHRPVAKPVILNPEEGKVTVSKPRTLELVTNNVKEHNKRNASMKWDNNLPISPIPDVSRVEHKTLETPDLILTSSPVQMLHSPTFKKNSTEKFLKFERNLLSNETTNRFLSPAPSPLTSHPLNVTYTKESPPADVFHTPSSGDTSKSARFFLSQGSRSPVRSPILISPRETFGSIADTFHSPKSGDVLSSPDSDTGYKLISPKSQKNIAEGAVDTSVFDFTNKNGVEKDHFPITVNKNVLEKSVPVSEPLKVEVNGYSSHEKKVIDAEKSDKKSIDLNKISNSAVKPGSKISDVNKTTNSESVRKSYPTLNFEQISNNSVENTEDFNLNESNNTSEVDNKLVFPKKLKPRVEESTQVFNFTKERRDVPDYISNDLSRVPQKPTLPQPGEGGIILIAGATVTSSFLDEDEEILRSLEGPPSPCDVTFINDNVVIGGRSSFIKESRRSKMKISFIETTDIFEYPSEDSLLLMDSSNPLMHSPSQSVGNAVPMLSGSTLANYMPKTMEDFQLGVTKSYQQQSSKPDVTNVTASSNSEMLHEEINHPSIFSNATNADILF